jgi:putative NIF3 family GTP cyclohydrolase 1 type 2
MNRRLSRRELLFAAGASLAAGALPADARSQSQSPLTASALIDRIKSRLNVPWNGATYRDTIKAGRPETVVHGVASTFMSSYDVIRKARGAGLNFVVTHEPTFWSDGDVVSDLKGDALYEEKRKYVEDNGMVIWRFHDHWHARKPDGIFVGWNRALGWERFITAENGRRFVIPQTTLGEMARHVASALQSRSVRMIGEEATRIRTVARGAHTLLGNMAAMPTADALLISEAREWDSIEYVRDTIACGQAKGAVLISHEAGEEAGMDECARWLRTFVPEVPVQFVPTTDLLWTVRT